METEKELRDVIKNYPHSLNKYIFKDAKEKLIKMGKSYKEDLNQVKEIVEAEPVVVNTPIEETERFKNLKRKTVKDLRWMASNMGLKGYSGLKEDDLIKRIILGK